MSFAAADFSDLANLKPERHGDNSLDIHPYFGRVDPALARELIKRLSEPGSVVLDPFCGSGTVLHAALLSGRSAVGWDSSQLAVLVATAKVLGAGDTEQRELNECTSDLERFGQRFGLVRESLPAEYAVPPMPRVRSVEYWFEPDPLRELAFLRYYLKEREADLSATASLLAWTAFSRIIVKASNQQGESSYHRIPKGHPPGKIVDLFIDAVRTVVDSAKEFHGAMLASHPDRDRISFRSNETSSRVGWNGIDAQVILRDSRSAASSTAPMLTPADVVVTSPPYLMSWDYGLYHKFRFYWLGYDLDTYEESEIGRHLRRQRNDVQRYATDMTSAFASIDRALSSSAWIALVNAPAVVRGEEIDTNEILHRCASEAGWVLEDSLATIGIPGPHHGMYASLGPRGTSTSGQRGKQEHVLVFRRRSS